MENVIDFVLMKDWVICVGNDLQEMLNLIIFYLKYV